MQRISPTRNRIYAVFYHWRHRPEEQEYDLEVRATTAERAIAKVKTYLLEQFVGTKADIVIDTVELRQ
jgi:hypothetical protein